MPTSQVGYLSCLRPTLILTGSNRTVLMVLGLALIGTFMISLFAVAQKNHVTLGLVVLNWALIIDAIGVIIIGSFIWWFTLQERNNFHGVYQALSSANRIFIQDKVCLFTRFSGPGRFS
jgi:hypothetical protein